LFFEAVADALHFSSGFLFSNLEGGVMKVTKSFIVVLVVPMSVFAGEIGFSEKDTVFRMSPVIITATQATERVTPVTFSDLNRTQLQQRYSTQDVPVLLSELPSVTYYSENGNGIGYNYINIRGFDQRRISIMVNGVPQNDPEDHNVYWIDFPDLMASAGNIQVQRGAGSAFYGPPAIGGSVNLVTNPFMPKPTLTLEAMGGFQEYGETKTTKLATRKYGVSINAGIVDQRYMFYSRLSKITTDGYRKNANDDLNSYFVGALRFDENMTTRLHFYGGPFSDGLVYNGLPKFFNKDPKLRRTNYNYFELNPAEDSVTYGTLRKPQEVESFSQPHAELLNDWQISKSVVVHNTIFFVQGEGYFDYDGDWVSYYDSNNKPTASNLWFRKYAGYDSTFGVTAFPSLLLRGFVGNKQWGWLPRVDISHVNGELTLGAEVRMHRSTHWGKIQYASQLPSTMYDPDFHIYEYNGQKDMLSLYGHELYRLHDNVTLMTDLQLLYTRYSILNEKFLNNTFSIPYFFANPRLGLNYNIDERWNGYVSLAYTSREPTLRNLYAAEDAYSGATPQFKADTLGGIVRYDFKSPFAKPEKLFDVEIGMGYRTENFRFSVNMFWMEFTDELVKSGTADIFGQPVTGNAERTRHVGIELDGSSALTANISLSGNATCSRNRLVKYSVIADNGIRDTLDNNPIAGFPDLLLNIRLTYSNDSFNASMTAKHVGAFFTDNFKYALHKNDAYSVFNAEISYRLPEVSKTVLTIRGEVRNIFNLLYTMSGEGQEFFPAAERNYLVGITAQL
jgi:iron complex outermembrane recepter protein